MAEDPRPVRRADSVPVEDERRAVAASTGMWESTVQGTPLNSRLLKPACANCSSWPAGSVVNCWNDVFNAQYLLYWACFEQISVG